MTSGNMWLQRTCLLFQLHYKEETDKMLMDSIITDAEAVVNFVENNELTPLSKREALKWLKNKGQI